MQKMFLINFFGWVLCYSFPHKNVDLQRAPGPLCQLAEVFTPEIVVADHWSLLVLSNFYYKIFIHLYWSVSVWVNIFFIALYRKIENVWQEKIPTL